MVHILFTILINFFSVHQLNEIKLNLKLIKTFHLDKAKHIIIDPSKICIGKNSDLIIYDNSDYTISIFDKEFNYKYSFGRKGKGPGEFNGKALLLATDYEERIFAVNILTNNISVFSYKGEYIRSFYVGFDDFFIENLVVHDGFIYFVTNSCLHKYNLQGAKIFKIKLRNSTPNSFYSMNQKFILPYKNEKLLVFLNDNYTIQEYDYDGNLLNSYSKKGFHNYPYDDEEQKKMPPVIKQNLPKNVLPSVANNVLLIDNFLIVCLKPRSKWNYKYKVDIFSINNGALINTLENNEFSVFNEAIVDNSSKECIAIIKDDPDNIMIKKYRFDFRTK